jgi:hypothetical protein
MVFFTCNPSTGRLLVGGSQLPGQPELHGETQSKEEGRKKGRKEGKKEGRKEGEILTFTRWGNGYFLF